MEQTQESLSDYMARIKKVKGHRKHRASNSYKTNDSYKEFKKTSNMPYKTYRAIIVRIHELMADALLRGETVKIPEDMGKLYFKRLDKNIRLIDGKLKIKQPVNWKETLKLWKEDAKCAKEKRLIWQDSPFTIRIIYRTNKSVFENKNFFKFTIARNIKLRAKQAMLDGTIDALK